MGWVRDKVVFACIASLKIGQTDIKTHNLQKRCETSLFSAVRQLQRSFYWLNGARREWEAGGINEILGCGPVCFWPKNLEKTLQLLGSQNSLSNIKW